MVSLPGGVWGGLIWNKDKRQKTKDKSHYEVQEGNNFNGTNHDDPVS